MYRIIVFLLALIPMSGMATPTDSPEYLGEGAEHNCFIITEEGDYWFNVSHLPNITSTFLLWNENGDSDITDVRLQGSQLHFTKNGSKKGNASITVTDDNDEILWTWWIWSTDQPEYYEKDGVWMMDRNLGATTTEIGSPDSYGLLFNPGNPFPFPGPKYKDFEITENPSVPEGWYVAEGYGFYTASKKPTPQTPMLLCSDRYKFGNSIYFTRGLNPCPDDAYTPTYATFLNFIGDEPEVSSQALLGKEGYAIPCISYNSIEKGSGQYLCTGIYNTSAVDTYVVYFYDEMAKLDYCQGAARLPIRAFSNSPSQSTAYPASLHITGNGSVYLNGVQILNPTFSIDSEKNAEFTFVPSEGYKIGGVEINGVDKTSEILDNNNSITLENQTGEVSITVTFSPITLWLNLAFEQGGAVGIESIYGQTRTLAFTVDEGWEIYGVYLNNTDVTKNVLEGLILTTPPLYDDTTVRIIYKENGLTDVDPLRNPEADDVILRILEAGKCSITLPHPEKVSVYSLSGTLTGSFSLSEGEHIIQVPGNSISLIVAGSQTFKVCM